MPPELARRGCHWTTTYPGGTKAGIEAGGKAELGVVNVWSCKGDGDGEKPGSLTIYKKIENASPIPVPPTTFLVDVNCQPGGPTATVTLNAGNGYQGAVNPIPAGRNCVITEQAPPVPANYLRMGCRWTTTYPAGQHAAIGVGTAAQLPVTNRWTCGDKPGPVINTGDLPNRGKPRTDVAPARTDPVRGHPGAATPDAVAAPDGVAPQTDTAPARQPKKPRVSVGFGVGGAARGDKPRDAAPADPGPGPRPKGGLAANDAGPVRRAAA